MVKRYAIMAIMGTALCAQSGAADRDDVRKLDDIAKFSTCANCDLSGAMLQGRLFRLANWPGANLSGAKLDKSDLSGALLWDANLSGASLTYANLSGAQMMGATLAGANFQHAWLLYVQAQNTNFGDADLTNALVRGMQVHGADLSRVKGLTERDLKELCGDGQTKPPGDGYIPRCSQ